jgi:hypothetical protein
MEALRRQPPTLLVAAAGAAAMVLGTIGPWVGSTNAGLSGARIGGGFLIGLGAIAALFLFQQAREGPRPAAVGGMTLGALGAFVCASYANDVTAGPAGIGVLGWGLYLSLAGSLALAIASYLSWRDQKY